MTSPWRRALCVLPFLFLGATRAADDPPRVTDVPTDVRESLKLDPFYKKYTSAGGLPVLASEKVSDAALLEARYLITQMLADRDDVLQAMIKNRVQFVVMAPTEMTTDVPEQRNMTPKEYWDRRARGLGGRVTSCGEENLLNLPGDRYRRENILVHEFSHAIHNLGLRTVDRTFNARLRETYDKAMKAGRWKDTYAATNAGEYWAEGVQSYFDCNAPPGSVHNDVNTREKLEKHDPDLFALIDEVFKKSRWRYVRYDRRTPCAKDAPVIPTAEAFAGLTLRPLGPTLTPGRVGDIAIDPRDRSVWYVAVASGGLWKTTNRGLTWSPIFENRGSYSLGCVTLDPKNPDVVWLGTGENQSQRSVGFGDGVYKSTDAGKTWNHVGLKDSEHIGKILVDPRNPDVVLVASQGPLWAPGGDRGLFKTTDGGKTWKAVLQVSENTGVTDVAFDPRNPDVIYAAAYQRRRHVGVLIGGGPESGIHKSEDGGATWTKLTKGLPSVDVGRIALAVSPQKPDTVYALITAAGKEGGFFRSDDRGATWARQSTYGVVDPQYYGEIYADPHKVDRVYAMDVNVNVTDDGGKTFRGQRWSVHPDNHALAFDPADPKHLLVGNDGGLYETYDGGASWRHFNNLPTTQFYRVAVDDRLPFYHVYGGTQDNGSLGGPSRTVNRIGIRTADWFVVGGSDGMQPRVDPDDPEVVYTMSQNGGIARLDLRTSASVPIRPRGPDTTNVRWSWDTPFLISPHTSTRLYLAGSRLFRSDDRGGSWKAISPDLTRQLDRDKLEVMGRLWGPDGVTKHRFTTDLGVATALAESPKQEGLLYVGTDDGLIQVSEDGGKSWRKVDRIGSVPEQCFVADLCASQHNANTVYAAFNHYQRGNFKPYLLRSDDRGRSWTSLAYTLPDRNPVWCIVEDHVNPKLLFAGTEFGLYFTADGGSTWVQLRGGVPTIAFRDLEIQRRESDLIAATFGRGFYVLDDYSPLRHVTPEALGREGVLFAPRRTWSYNEASYVRAAGNHTTPNPPFGALFTYHLRGDADVRYVLAITDADGKPIREIVAPSGSGIHRVAWDLRADGSGRGAGARVEPGKYRVSLIRTANGQRTTLGEAHTFSVVALPGR